MYKYILWLAQRFPKLGRHILHSATPQIMVMTFIGMSLALLVDILIAARLGTTRATDALIIALSIPRMIEVIGREGTRFSLLTLFVEICEKHEKEEILKFFNGLLNLYLVIGLIFTSVSIFLAPYIIALVGPGLPPAYRQDATQLFRLGIFLVVFALGSTVFEAFLNSQHKFIIASSRNAILSGSVVCAIVLGWNYSNISIWIISAYSIGYLLFFGLLFWYSMKKLDFVYILNSWPNKKHMAQIWRPVFYPTTSFGIRLLSRIAERAIISTILPGGVAIYYFAFRLVSASQSIIGISVTTTGLPNISRLALERKYDHFIKATHKQAMRVIFIGLLFSAIIIFFHEPITKILFGRGDIKETSIDQIGMVLQILGGALLFWSLTPVFSSSLFALQKYTQVFFNFILIAFVNLCLDWILAQRMGLLGVALATTISVMFSAFILYFMLLISIHNLRKNNPERHSIIKDE